MPRDVIDFNIDHCGSVVMITPMHNEARWWTEDTFSIEPWQWMGASFAVDHRNAPDVLALIDEAGWTIAPEASHAAL